MHPANAARAWLPRGQVLPAHKGVGTQVNVWANLVGLPLNVPCGQTQIQRWLTCRDSRELKRSIYYGAVIGMLFPSMTGLALILVSPAQLAGIAFARRVVDPYSASCLETNDCMARLC